MSTEIHDAIRVLKNAVHTCECLWQTTAIMDKYDCNSEVATELMNMVLDSETTHQAIWDNVKFFADEMGLTKLEKKS